MLARLVCLAVLTLSASTARAQRPALYVEGGGASGLYAIGVEQRVFTSVNGAQHFGVRAGAGYWTERDVFSDGREAYGSAPLAATASFQLPRVPVRFEAAGGVVLALERFAVPRYNGQKLDLSALPFGEAALRVAVARGLFVRGGAVVGGRHDFVAEGAVAPVLGVGVQL